MVIQTSIKWGLLWMPYRSCCIPSFCLGNRLRRRCLLPQKSQVSIKRKCRPRSAPPSCCDERYSSELAGERHHRLCVTAQIEVMEKSPACVIREEGSSRFPPLQTGRFINPNAGVDCAFVSPKKKERKVPSSLISWIAIQFAHRYGGSEGDAFQMQMRNERWDLPLSLKRSSEIYGGCGANFL